MTNPNPSPKDQFQPGNAAHNTAGGVAAGIKDLAAGKTLRGDLATIQYRVDQQLETHEGRVHAQRWLTAAFFTITQGLLCVVQEALTENEQDKAIAYIRNFGTFGSKAGAELARLDELAQERDGQALDYDTLVQELRGADGSR